MSCKKVISSLAKEDINENVLWYNSRQKGLGIQFSSEIRRTINYIIKYPESFPTKYNDVRIAVVDIFPFTIHYFYDEPNNTVFISCVFKDSRNPEIPKSIVRKKNYF